MKAHNAINVKKWDRYWILNIIREIEPSIRRNWKIVRKFLCKCDCWNQKEIRLFSLRKSKSSTKSCGCLNLKKLLEVNTTHWKSKKRIYKIYRAILTRCNNEKENAYKDYGWRWIKCEWNSFEEFYDDMKEWYSDDLQIDRINNDWNYFKENCRWVTPKQNSRNRRSNIIYKWKCVAEWEEITWVNRYKIYSRLRSWWVWEKALEIKK